MAGFQIPGLGQAKPNETLPPLPGNQPVEPVAAAVAVPVAAPVAVPVVAPDSVPVAEAQEQHQPCELPALNEQHQPETTGSNARDNTEQDRAPIATDAEPDKDSMVLDRPESPPSLTGALEAAIGGLEDTDMTHDAQVQDRADSQPETEPHPETVPQPENGELQPHEAENPEWEIDSSPYESSSESSSSDSSDEDSDNERYELLGVEETARLLMEMEGGDEDGEKGDKAASAAQLRTKNELPEEVIPKPDITLTPEMKIEELGSVEHVVQNTILVKAITPGEYQVLDTGSVLCTEERLVIGVVAETIGKVLQPMYTVRFNSQEEINEFGVQVGTKIFYPVDHASYVFTEPLKGLKGSDASNIHDEEVAADEMEFSDDEKEAEYKRTLKSKKNKNKGPGGRGPHPLRQEVAPDAEIDYDDGPYKPLTRPPGFGSGAASKESLELPSRLPPQRGGGGRRGDRRGRGGRGGRGRDSSWGNGRGGPDQARDGYSLPPRGYQQQPSQPQPGNPWPSNTPPVPTQGAGPTMPGFGFQLPPNWPQQMAPPAHGAAATPPPPPGWPSQGPAQGQQGATGAFVNPALIAALMSHMQGQAGQQPWGGQGQPPPPPPGGWS